MPRATKSMDSEMFQEKAQGLLSQLSTLTSGRGRLEAFSGPAMYFHRVALQRSFPLVPARLQESCESVYAMLATWGMHRMGKNGSKMRNFEEFMHSIEGLSPEIIELQGKSIKTMVDSDWKVLKHIFLNICVMQSKPILVGHSKVLAHFLPNLVAPIDRNYTLRYLLGTTTHSNLLDTQIQLFLGITRHFYHVVASDPTYMRYAKQLTRENPEWNSSILKTVDNLVIAVR